MKKIKKDINLVNKKFWKKERKKSGLVWTKDWRNLSGFSAAGPGFYWLREEESPVQRQKMDPGRKSFHINLTTTVSEVNR